MPTKKLYLYWRVLTSPSNENEKFTTNKGVLLSYKWPGLLGLDRSLWRGHRLDLFEKELSLKSFEVTQTLFERFIEFADNIGIRIISLEFTEELPDDDDHRLRYLLRNPDYDRMLDFVHEQSRVYGRDIESASFSPNASRSFTHITITKNAVLIVENEEEPVSEIMSSMPIGLLSGNYIPNLDEMAKSHDET